MSATRISLAQPSVQHAGRIGHVCGSARQQQYCAARRGFVAPCRQREDESAWFVRDLLRQPRHRCTGHCLHHQWCGGRPHAGVEVPSLDRGLERTRTQAAGTAGRDRAQPRDLPRPGAKTSFAHHFSAGVDRELPHRIRMAASYVFARGFNQLGTIDYNPLVPALGAGRRPLDVDGRAGTSASVLQYTSFGETWYNGLTLSAAKLLGHRYQFLASYTLSKAEDTSTDFPSAFIPENNGLGRDPSDPDGLPIGFDPDSERGPSLQDQRHHLVLSGIYTAPYDVNVSAIIAVVSGRPYNIIAGVDLNGDGDGGTIPGPDRARTNPADSGHVDRTQQWHAAVAGDSGRAREQDRASWQSGSSGDNLRSIQPVQSCELHGRQQCVRNRRLPIESVANIRPVPSDGTVPSDAAGYKDHILKARRPAPATASSSLRATVISPLRNTQMTALVD